MWATRKISDGCSLHGNPRFKRVIAHAFERRSKTTLNKLLKRLRAYPFLLLLHRSMEALSIKVPNSKHVISKLFTQRIERNNRTLPTRLKRLNRKTICFSRSAEIHDKVIGEFISRMYYQCV
ncbi:hypothetical protein CI610_03200 [invertebrate metagenome]|uniref:Transposase n=1 Tax=invertebrate metagenome TaxID=1711999 RepID=A0A2H9T3U5_9ZZZZ